MKNFLILFFPLCAFSIFIPVSRIGESYCIALQFGNNNFTKYFEVDLQIPYTWISDINYKKSTSIKTHTSGKKVVKAGLVAEYEINSDYFLITNTDIYVKDFYFYYYKTILSDYDSITFAHKIEDQKFSPVFNLFNKGIINTPSFGFVFRNDKLRDGELHFGGFPQNITNEYKYNAEIKTKKDKVGWETQLTRAIFGEEAYPVGKPAIFQTSSDKILCPKDFINFLNRSFFDKFYPTRECYHQNLIYGTIICKCEIFEELPELNLVFDGVTLKTDRKTLYRKSGKSCKFNIQENYINNSEWLISTMTLNKYPLMFDYFKSSIQVFSKNKFVRKNPIEIFVKILCFLNGFFILFLLFISTFLKHNEKNKNFRVINIL